MSHLLDTMKVEASESWDGLRRRYILLTFGGGHVVLLHACHVHFELTLVVEHVVAVAPVLNAVVGSTRG